MKHLLVLLLGLSIFGLTGCSFLSDVSNGFNYAQEAKDYIGEVQTFANDVPNLGKQAVTDENARLELEASLKEMKTDIQDFNSLTPPSIAEDIHGTVVAQNETLEAWIDVYLENVQNGKLSLDIIEQFESDLLAEIKVYSELLNDLKNIAN